MVERLTGKEMADELTKSIGQGVIHNNVSPNASQSFGFSGADDLGNMFQ